MLSGMLFLMVEMPRSDKRTAIIGSTGSGKTQFAVWLLSRRDYDKRPWVIFDFKGDSLISDLEDAGAKEISIFGAPPKKAGIYIVRPIPELHDNAVEKFLWACWSKEFIGLYVDEGYMLGNRNPALNACLTQGRSKNIEMIILSQRPVWMSKFVFSEANFFAVFNLTLEDDRKHVRGYIGNSEINLLPKYNCLWYDVDNQEGVLFQPVPKAAEIIASFADKLNNRPTAI